MYARYGKGQGWAREKVGRKDRIGGSRSSRQPGADWNKRLQGTLREHLIGNFVRGTGLVPVPGCREGTEEATKDGSKRRV